MLGLACLVFGIMLVWSASQPRASSGSWLSTTSCLLGLTARSSFSGRAPSESPSISSLGPLFWKKTKEMRIQDPDHVHAQLWCPWRGLGSCCCGRRPDVSYAPPCLLAEGRLLWSSPSPVFEAKQRRSPPGDRWAVFVHPVTLLAERRPSVATTLFVRIFNLLSWRVCFLCLESMAWANGNLVEPCGFVPGAGKVDLEQRQGLDCFLAFQLKVLSIKIQGPVCNSRVVVGPVVR